MMPPAGGARFTRRNVHAAMGICIPPRSRPTNAMREEASHLAPKTTLDESEPEPEPENDDAAWARFAPKFKQLQKEAMDEWLDEVIAQGEEVTESEDEPDTEPVRPAPRVGGSTGAGRRGAAIGGIAGAAKTRKERAAPRPSGGSILDVFIGR